MSVRSARVCFSVSFLLLCAIAAGCAGEEDPIEARLKEVGYTPEKIVAELELRIKNLDKMSAHQHSAGNDSKQGGTRTSDPRGNPFSFDSIIKDIKHKIDQVQQRSGEDVNVLEQVTQKIENGKLDDTMRKRVLEALQK